MELICSEITPQDPGKPRIGLAVERMTLAKRRWRGVAADGREFGFDLAQPLADGTIFFETGSNLYVVAQQPEPLLEIKPGGSPQAARIGWMIGNLHFPIGIAEGAILAPDDPAVRQLLEREQTGFTLVRQVFHPLKSAHHHGH